MSKDIAISSMCLSSLTQLVNMLKTYVITVVNYFLLSPEKSLLFYHVSIFCYIAIFKVFDTAALIQLPTLFDLLLQLYINERLFIEQEFSLLLLATLFVGFAIFVFVRYRIIVHDKPF